jgi:L-histidine Nalpha-methyltransferase
MSYTIDVHLSPHEVRNQMRSDALKGLQGDEKSIPPVWFYDERGSRLFEEITQLPEYYPTRAERALLQEFGPSIAEVSKADTLVELGAGACDKTRVLLSAFQESGTLARYVPFDVSDEFLRDAATTLSDEFETLEIHLVIGDFHQHLAEIPTQGRRMVAFLGGTIGNLNPAQRARFLFDLNCTMSSDDSLLLGTDLVKDRSGLRRRRGRDRRLQPECPPRAQRAAGWRLRPRALSSRRALERGRAVDRDAPPRARGHGGLTGWCRHHCPV